MTITDNMTKNALRFFKDMEKEETHPLSCFCGVCLYFQYKKRPKHKGRRFGKRIYFLNSLIHEVKMNHLIKNGKAEETFKDGRKAWKLIPGEYDKAPYFKKAREILNELYHLSEDNDLFLILYDFLPVYHKRTKNPNFSKMQEELSQERWWEWIKTQPHLQQKWNKNWESFKFTQRVSEFIYSQTKNQITQRELLRHFSNKRKEDLIRVQDWLRINYGVNIRSKGKSVIYYGAMKSSGGRYWRVGS